MARKHYSLHYVKSATRGEMLCVPKHMQAWLVAWADTDPTVAAYSMDGPAWRYVTNGRDAEAKVPMTVQRVDGTTAYWDAVDDRVKTPASVAVKREHSLLQGIEYWVMSTTFVNDNVIEHKNRVSAHRLLAAATPYDSKALETTLLMSVGAQPAQVGALAQSTASSEYRVLVAALRLWRRGLLKLPMRDQLLGPDWVIEGETHGLE